MKALRCIGPRVLAGLLAAVSAGCGYTTQPLFPMNVQTVNVPIWTVGKDVYRRLLEDRLTEAITKRINLDTPYRIAPKGTADTQLMGTVEKVEQAVLSSNPHTGRPRELEITITVSFTWTDLRTGKVLVTEPEFRCVGTYIPHCPFGEDFFEGSEDVMNEFAKRIVEKLEADW